MNEFNPSAGPRSRGRHARRAFTLLELIIVIGVIITLLALTLGVGSMVVSQSENRQLRSTMTIVDAALAEFKSQTGRELVFQGVAGSVCSPAATGIAKSKCPTDTPAGCKITPAAILQDQSGDKYCALECSPSLPIKDAVERVHGIKASDLDGVAFTLAHAQAALAQLCSDRTVLIGHAVANDLEALRFRHGCIVDTSVAYGVVGAAAPTTP